MSNLTVIIFDDVEQAKQVKESLEKQQKQGLIKIDDTAIIVKDADGKAHVDQQFLDSSAKTGVVVGSILGLVITGIFAPVLGLVGGAVAGGLIGKTVDQGIEKSFVEEVSNELKPSTSALFIVAHDANANAVSAALRQYEGKVYHTTLDTETEEQLRHTLGDK